MKVLWLSNKQILNSEVKGSGSWIKSMADELSVSGNIELVNITAGNVDTVKKSESYNQKEFVVPRYKTGKNGVPRPSDIKTIVNIVEGENPDIIHVWGVENYWGLLISRGYISGKSFLLDMQGVLEACYEFYMGNLCLDDFMRNMGFFQSLYAYSFVKLQKYRMHKRIKYENEIISAFPNIAYQSKWVKSWLDYKNPQAKLFPTKIAVRQEFIDAKPWKSTGNQRNILLVSSQQAYKRIDIAIKALNVIRKEGVDANLIIIGDVFVNRKGYSMYLAALIRKMGLDNWVHFVGSKNATEIIELSKDACCMVVPSAVESFSMVMAECMALGLPVVASYSGAMPEFFEGMIVPVYFPSGDYVRCASIIRDLMSTPKLCEEISTKGMSLRKSNEDIAKVQIGIYTSLMKNKEQN